MTASPEAEVASGRENVASRRKEEVLSWEDEEEVLEEDMSVKYTQKARRTLNATTSGTTWTAMSKRRICRGPKFW